MHTPAPSAAAHRSTKFLASHFMQHCSQHINHTAAITLTKFFTTLSMQIPAPSAAAHRPAKTPAQKPIKHCSSHPNKDIAVIAFKTDLPYHSIVLTPVSRSTTPERFLTPLAHSLTPSAVIYKQAKTRASNFTKHCSYHTNKNLAGIAFNRACTVTSPCQNHHNIYHPSSHKNTLHKIYTESRGPQNKVHPSTPMHISHSKSL